MDGYIGGEDFPIIRSRFFISVGNMFLLMGTDCITAQTIPELIIYYLISFIVSLLVGILASGEAYLYYCGKSCNKKKTCESIRLMMKITAIPITQKMDISNR